MGCGCVSRSILPSSGRRRLGANDAHLPRKAAVPRAFANFADCVPLGPTSAAWPSEVKPPAGSAGLGRTSPRSPPRPQPGSPPRPPQRPMKVPLPAFPPDQCWATPKAPPSPSTPSPPPSSPAAMAAFFGGRPSSRSGNSRGSFVAASLPLPQHLAKAASDYAAPDYENVHGSAADFENEQCDTYGMFDGEPRAGQCVQQQQESLQARYELEAAAEAKFEDEDPEAVIMREFMKAAQQLSASELREFVEDHVSSELAAIRRKPAEQRAQAFRSLCAEWHPDKCPAIAGLATEVFQRLQSQKSVVLSPLPT
mmetsp:Transcript_108953/g.347880  ORF Transcript_108953/g.347880 Transcript_108953/m.347880 type:complete len:310 (-) Transcript_108953:90-1019(-)